MPHDTGRRFDVELGDSFGIGVDPPPSEVRERNRARGHTETHFDEHRRVSNHPWDHNDQDQNSYEEEPLPNLNEEDLSTAGGGLFDDLASDQKSQHSLPAVRKGFA